MGFSSQKKEVSDEMEDTKTLAPSLSLVLINSLEALNFGIFIRMTCKTVLITPSLKQPQLIFPFLGPD